MNQNRPDAGFSLVELLVAMLILGVAVVGLTQGITSALRSSKDCELLTTASLIAAGQIELFRAEGYVREGVTQGQCETLPLYQWRQTVSRSSLDGLYEVALAVEHSKTGELLYELRTMLFDAPSESGREKAGSARSKSRQRARK